MLIAAAASVGAQETPSRIETARRAIKLFLEKKLPDFIALGDARFKEKFTPDVATAMWDQLHFRIGHYQGEDSARLIREEGRDIVAFELRFERGRADIRAGLSPSGEIVGLWIDRIQPEVAYVIPGYVDEETFIDEPASVVAHERFPLKARLAIPEGDGPFPGVVLIADSGPLDANATIGPNQPFKDIAWGFASQKLAVLRYDKRSADYPRAYPPGDWTPEVEYLEDALAAVKTLRRHPRVDPKSVFIVGHGMGAMMTPFIAQKDPEIAGIVMLAAPGRPLLNAIEDQLQYLVGLDNKITEKEQEDLASVLAAIASIRAGQPEGAILGTPAVYWSRYEKLDPVGAALATRQPMLILRGERDFQVVEEDMEIWKNRLKDRPDVEYRSYRRLNHLLMGGQGSGPPAPSEYRDPGKVAKELVIETAHWILSRAPKAASPATPGATSEPDEPVEPTGKVSPDGKPQP
jgi:dienelactone hydrolase